MKNLEKNTQKTLEDVTQIENCVLKEDTSSNEIDTKEGVFEKNEIEKDEESNLDETKNDDNNFTFNPRSLSFWIGLVAVVLGTLEAILIAFNVKIEINLLVEGLSTILFMLVCLGVLKTTNKDIAKDDITSDLKKKIKSKKEKTQDKGE